MLQEGQKIDMNGKIMEKNMKNKSMQNNMKNKSMDDKMDTPIINNNSQKMDTTLMNKPVD